MNTIASSPLPAMSLTDIGPLGETPETLVGQLDRNNPRSVDQLSSGFESLFVALVLKEMRQTLGPGSLFGGDQSDIYGGMFDQYMGQALAHSGGFGLAAQIQRQLAANLSNKPVETGVSQ